MNFKNAGVIFPRRFEMPIYEYKCDTCNKSFELLVLGSDQPTCPTCGTPEIKRLMSCCGFVSKGSGAPGEAPTFKSSAGMSGCAGCSSTNCGSCGI